MNLSKYDCRIKDGIEKHVHIGLAYFHFPSSNGLGGLQYYSWVSDIVLHSLGNKRTVVILILN
ncbi:hypothetical protein ACTXT7_005340 [Hymenolepis weldensis]